METREDYISFETAKLMKEKGFDVPTYSVWVDHSKLVGCPAGISMFPNVENWNAIDDGMSDIYFSAPTLQMAMKWLREVHKLHIVIDVHESYAYEPKIVFIWYVWNLNTHKKFTIINYSETFEQTCENAIMYCLTNLI